MVNVGIVGTGIYIPGKRMTAAEISEATKGVWSENAVIEKLGIVEKPIPGKEDGTQQMGVNAALDCLKNTGINPLEIDLILCIGEEWKEYPLTTSGIYIQEKIGADNAWAIDIQQRCNSTIAAMKIAKDMMIADEEIKTVMIVGGYRNGDFIDFEDSSVSFMFNLSAGAGAMILKRNYGKNLILGTHIITDGTLARDAGVLYGGTENPITCENANVAYKSLKVFDEKHMKDRLNEVSMKNWFHCIDKAFEKSEVLKSELGFLCCLHFKRSMYDFMLAELGLTTEQSIYLEQYGHIGQIDPILVLHLAQQKGLLKEGTVISMIAAGIGYAWGANVIKWG
ncbi:3-oxoacyl-(acyl-carrier-protein) synthase, KASIII [uncultured Paludibacter sp.]|uniref:3-oxoacyl-(Acyl-carrier-protein) synthase, KASIII n=1 Tax=uncultured Paludibacter sp. TaxID=497635 RepID=A0A653A5R9_9BACT|nr:3-oxoacyl-(acyl-carrier-protein) synthase, KASIII [uncultured Paludibacter sp.]